MQKKMILIMIALLFVGCASNRYILADKYLDQEKYEQALNEYIRLAKGASSLKLSRDIEALTGAMISYYSLGNYKNSFALSRRILSLESYNSRAVFYAGMNLETSKKYSLAKKIYRYYQLVSPSDPYYQLIKSRFTLMVEKEMAEKAKLAIKMEKSVGVGSTIDNTIAVLYFLNILEDSKWNSVSKGLAEMMITDLSQIKSLKVIERIHIQSLMDEMALGMSGLADESTSPRMGKLLRAKNLVNGSFMVKTGRNLTINSDLLDVNGVRDYDGNEFSGELKDILNIEKKIVFNTLKNLGITASKSEIINIKRNTTKSIEAFLAFSLGLDKYDQNDYDGAISSFTQALKFDPKFRMAQIKANLTQALKIVQQGTFHGKHKAMMGRRFASAGGKRRGPGMGMRGKNFVRFRLQQVARNLDLGYLPGNDSRNGSSEIISEDVFDQLPEWTRILELLPAPPKPPVPPNSP
ncbi:hypothetical protein H8E88_19790 [candidate division KSB1 bacterium]|nr:hypothetical protein [candidate division KSB1 bacterium]